MYHLQFGIKVSPILVKNRECKPLFAAYLTEDLRPITSVDNKKLLPTENFYASVLLPDGEMLRVSDAWKLIVASRVIPTNAATAAAAAPYYYNIEPQPTACVFASDSYQRRIAKGTSMKTISPNMVPEGERYGSEVYRPQEPLEAQVTLHTRDATITVTPESAICIQMFCEVACGDSDWGLHACGWTCVPLSELINGETRTVPLCDQGRSSVGARGSVTVTLLRNQTTAMLSTPATLLLSKGDETPLVSLSARQNGRGKIVWRDLAEYNSRLVRITSNMSLSDNRILVYTQPDYASCGGCSVRPPCAYIMDVEPPHLSEQYYLEALSIVLRRRSRATSDTSALIKTTERFMFGDVNDPNYMNETAGILMEMAMMLATSCTYLFDEVLEQQGRNLTVGEDFSRCLGFTLTGDCEDDSHSAIMVLWDILEARSAALPGMWNSPAMQRLQLVRKYYVATIILKAVTRPSVSHSWMHQRDYYYGEQRETFAAHDCCDLIPIAALIRYLEGATLAEHNKEAIEFLRGIASERKIAGDGDMSTQTLHQGLKVIVGEGTGRVTSYSTSPWDPARISRRTKRRAAGVFSSALPNHGIPVCENHEKDEEGVSSFYTYALTAYIHDTLLYARKKGLDDWILPQVVFTLERGSTLGIPHTDYVACNGSSGSAVAMPPPGPNAMRVMREMEKYEIPNVPYESNPLWIDGSSTLRDRFAIVKEKLVGSNARGRLDSDGGNDTIGSRRIVADGHARTVLEVNVALTDLTEESIDALIEDIKSYRDARFNIIDIQLEDIATGIGMVAMLVEIE